MNYTNINVQKPSNFIANIFKPLQNFIILNLLNEKASEMLKKEVLDKVFESFRSLVQEILNSTIKSQELMNKFVIFFFIWII